MLGDKLLKPDYNASSIVYEANGTMTAGEQEVASWCHGDEGGLIWNRYLIVL